MRRGLMVNKKGFFISMVLFFIMEIIVGSSDNFITMVLRGFLCFILVYCIYKGMEEEYIVNPYFLFSVTPFSLLLYTETFSTRYLNKLDNSTFGLGIINMLAFLVAFNRVKPSRKIEFMEGDDSNLSEYRMVIHGIILAVLGELPNILSMMGINIPFKAIIGFFLYIGIVFAFRSKKKWAIFVVLGFSLLNFWDDFNKTRLLYLCITIMCALETYYIENKREKFRFVGMIVLAATFLIFVAFPLKSFTRSGGSIFSFFQNMNQISGDVFSFYNDRFDNSMPYFLRMPYMYLVQAWNNVQYVMQTQNERTYGLWMLKPLLGYLQIDSFFQESYELIPYSTFNTFTYITVLFKDFGYWGSMIGSAFLGFYVKKVYSKIGTGASAFDVATYGLVAVATLEMFFSNHFFGQSYPFTILLIGWVYKKLFRLERY